MNTPTTLLRYDFNISEWEKEPEMAAYLEGDWVKYADLQAYVRGLEADAARWRAMRSKLVGVDFNPEMGGAPVVMFECHASVVSGGPIGADAIADAAISATAKGRGDG